MPSIRENSQAPPTALVTGSGAPRIGNCIVRALARRGYRVAVHANTSREQAEATAAEIVAAGGEAMSVAGDLRDEAAVRRIVAETRSRFGSLDVLVNCASIWERKKLEETTAEDVRRHFEINTLGTFLCCQHAGLEMTRQERGGVIVNFGDWAVQRPYLDYAAYFASKGAIETLTRTFAVELARRNPRVRVNAIFPGPAMLPDTLSPAEKSAAIAATLVQRAGRPENIAQAAIALIENDFITGACLAVDGGRTVA